MILVGSAESSGAALLLPVPVELWTAHDGHGLPVEGQGYSRATFKQWPSNIKAMAEQQMSNGQATA